MKIAAVLLGLFVLVPQSVMLPGPGLGSFSQPITLGVHANTDNTTTSATTVVVSLGTPTAGSTIVCAWKTPDGSTFVSLADNVNTGVYQPAAVNTRDAAHFGRAAIFYKENVAASSTTITLTWTTAGTQAKMACAEAKNTPTAYAFDSTFVATRATTGTNPNSGSTLTPFGDGRFLYGALVFSTGTTTAGANFTLLDNAGAVASGALYPEYWIQTTATATTTPFVDASSTGYAAFAAAFAPASAVGFCDATMIIDWTGGTNGNVPAAADLQTGTKGGLNQPNASTNGIFLAIPQWVATSTGVTYTTAGYAPLVTTRTCPFYSGSASGTLGIKRPTGDTVGALDYRYFTTQDKVTAWTCVSTDFSPVSHSGTVDLFKLGNTNGTDYVNLKMPSNGTTGTFSAELKSGSITTPTVNWVANTWYGVRLTYVKGGTHSIDYYSFSGSQCTGTPTLMGTQSGPATGSNLSNDINLFGGNSNTYGAGVGSFYMGAVVLDILYGATIVP